METDDALVAQGAGEGVATWLHSGQEAKDKGNAFISDFSQSWTDIPVFDFRKISQCIEKTCRRQDLEAIGFCKGATIVNKRCPRPYWRRMRGGRERELRRQNVINVGHSAGDG